MKTTTETAQLFEAIEAGDRQQVHGLIASDPSLAQARNEEGLSPVLQALYRLNRPTADELVGELLAAEPELDIFDASALGNVERVTELLDADAEQANAWSADGFRPLHLACFFGRPEVVGRLLERGAEMEVMSKNPQIRVMPINSAAAGGGAETVRVLLEHGADPNARAEQGFTALHAAAQHGDFELADLLLRHDAARSARTDDGKTPADLAREHGHGELAARLELPG